MKLLIWCLAVLLIASVFAAEDIFVPTQTTQPTSVEESQRLAIETKNKTFPAPQEPLEISSGTDFKKTEVSTKQDLAEWIINKKLADSKLKDAQASDDKVITKYTYKSKLFALIPLAYSIETSIQAKKNGRIKVKFPWWIVLTNTDTQQMQIDIEDGVNEKMNSYPDTPDDIQLKARLLEALVNANQKVKSN
ncbi:MAG: hypothetical protein AABX51_00530 [Nanoarchaeota archaeon]